LGMTKLQAEALPKLATRRRSLAQEQNAHAAAMDCASAFSPRVESITPDAVVLDIAGLERLFGPTVGIARELSRRAAACGLEANVAAAGNMEAAGHAARGFAGITIVERGAEAERLSLLPIEVLIRPSLVSCDVPEKNTKNRRAPAQYKPEELLEIF